MDVLDAIRSRRSVRSYEDRTVEEEKLNRVLEAGRLAPSAKNRQQWKFIVVRDGDTRAKLAEACNGQKFVGQAPVVIVACGMETEDRMSSGQPTTTVDSTISLDHMTLQAEAEGLGTCWIGAFQALEVKALLGVPADVDVVHVTPLGYAKEKPEARLRKELAEIICYEKWEV
jgi:nitroreductase